MRTMTSTHREIKGRAETNADSEQGRRKAQIRDGIITVVERDVVEGFGNRVVGWGIGDVKVRGGGRACQVR